MTYEEAAQAARELAVYQPMFSELLVVKSVESPGWHVRCHAPGEITLSIYSREAWEAVRPLVAEALRYG